MANNVRIGTQVTGVGKASSDLDNLRDKFDRLQKQGAKGFAIGAGAAITTAGINAVGAAVGGVTNLMGDAVNKASDLNETMSKSGVVFGRNADEVSEWGDSAADAFGLSKQAAIESAASFGDLFNKVGIGSEKSKEMAQSLVGLSADLASFNNLAGGTDEALEKIKSGLAGETEPLRSLGVFLNEAKVKAKAAELGLGGLNGELTEGAKIQARYALILEETASAQGDFARTSDGLANKQRINQAKLDDGLAKLGNILLPLVSDAAEDASGALEAFAVVIGLLNGELPQNDQHLQSLSKTIAGLNPVTGMAVNQMEDLEEKQEAAAREAEALAEGQRRLSESTEETTARLLEQGKTADGTRLDLIGLGAAYDVAGGAADGVAGAMLAAADAVADEARETRDATDAAEDLERALDDLTDAALDAAGAFGDQKFSADELKGRMAELTEELLEAREELEELEKIKNPTKDQRRDIEITKGRVAELEHQFFDTRVELAEMDKASLDALMKELASAQYKAGKLGDSARAALAVFQKLSFANKNAPGFRGDPGFTPRAGGGPVSPNKAYIVGEEGPEVFVPNSSGNIVPNGGSGTPTGGGGMTFAPTIVIQGVATPAVMAQIQNELGPVMLDYFRRQGALG